MVLRQVPGILILELQIYTTSFELWQMYERCPKAVVAVAQSVERPFKGPSKRCNSLTWVQIPAAA